MKRAWLVILLLASVGLNLGLWLRRSGRQEADLGAPPPLPAAATEARLGRFADRLDLAGDERRRFIELHVDFLATLRAEAGELAQVRLELREEMTAADPDHARVEQLVDSSARHLAALELSFARTVLASRELLDGEAERRYLRTIAELRARHLDHRPGWRALLSRR